uniref:Uncharacterized protein n=2 Tax=Caenorhabditis japonica TaxID=281687 RepID=A0A8R1EWW4_CAEJA
MCLFKVPLYKCKCKSSIAQTVLAFFSSLPCTTPTIPSHLISSHPPGMTSQKGKRVAKRLIARAQIRPFVALVSAICVIHSRPLLYVVQKKERQNQSSVTHFLEASARVMDEFVWDNQMRKWLAEHIKECIEWGLEGIDGRGLGMNP